MANDVRTSNETQKTRESEFPGCSSAQLRTETVLAEVTQLIR